MRDTEGKIAFKALTSGQYKALKAELKKEYSEKGKTWLAAKKKAEADGSEFTDSRPVKPRYKALDKLSSRTSALKMAQKYQRKYEAQKREKERQAAEAI